MTLPNLRNPVDTEIKPLDKSKTKYNNRRRENVNIIRRSPTITIKSQIVYFRSSTAASQDNPNWEGAQNIGLGGVVEESDGYIVVRFKDLTALGYDPKRGDKISKLAQLDVDYFVTGKRPGAHYPDQGGFTLLQIFFRDRNP